MAKKSPKKRTKKYEPKVALKKDVEWDDLINLSLQPPKKVGKKTKKNSQKDGL